MTKASVLNQISMVTANYGESAVFADVIHDWFQFLGGKPGEVVVVDCGSDRATQSVCWQMFQSGEIDKLQIIHPEHEEFGKEKGYVREYTAGAIASKPYVLVFKTDTLPFRSGHEGWLEEAISYLDRPDIFAVGGSYNVPCKHHDAWDGWYFSKKCSYNFALMKRETFMAAAHEFANEFILSGFKSHNPAALTGQDRFFIEVAFEQYIQRHELFTLMKVEDRNWTVFHTNVHDEKLKQTRDRYLARKDISRFMNAGLPPEELAPDKALYYGQPHPGLTWRWRRFRVAFGNSALGSQWRSLKQLSRRQVAEPVTLPPTQLQSFEDTQLT